MLSIPTYLTHTIYRGIVAILGHVIPVYSVFAWNDTGHRLVALIAYEQLDETTSTNVIGILEKQKEI